MSKSLWDFTYLCCDEPSVLSIVNEQTGFLKQFIHDIPSRQHHRPEDNALFTALIAYGSNVGIARMARITKGQSQAVLENLAALYMHTDNTKRANDCILRKIDEISNHFIAAKLRHTSSDGQKQIVDGDSLNANRHLLKLIILIFLYQAPNYKLLR